MERLSDLASDGFDIDRKGPVCRAKIKDLLTGRESDERQPRFLEASRNAVLNSW
jgi:hypothetical protein